MTKLSAAKAKTLSSPGRYSDGGGLYLQVRSAENKSWLLRYMLDGRSREMGLGPYPEISLADARERALLHRRILKDPDNPQDPLELRRMKRIQAALASAKRLSFSDAFERYVESKRAGWANSKSEGQWRATMRDYVFPSIGECTVEQITTQDVLQVLSPIWAEKNETASRVRSRIEAVLNSAKASGAPVGENPARWRGHLDQLLPHPSKVQDREHHPALPHESIKEFMKALQQRTGTAALALEFAILTAARTSEVREAIWSEFNVSKMEWNIPDRRMKAVKPHTVPLSPRCMAILRTVKNLDPVCVFPSPGTSKPLSLNGLRALLHRMGYEDFTVHGFRSTFRDWGGETGKYSKEVLDHALSHKEGDKATQAYARSTLLPLRKALMIDWAKYCGY